MSTTLHSFIDIFDAVFSDGQNSVKLKKIIIPIIQRDYAQGRQNPEINRVRNRFLDSLLEAVETKPITLDFVYGDINAEGVLTPLDGQQRLTTLFLLHWYASKKDKVPVPETLFLNNFSYETRYSARNFCEDLVQFVPSFTMSISEEIIDQPWFPLEWKKDPTISSMLVMIDSIHDKFFSVENLWDKLKKGAITFYFLPIRDMGLTDELYIKMNSRGKPLTRFEHFKAELERLIRNIDEETAKRIIRKIDLDWTDMLWMYRDSGTGSPDDSITDDEFLKYFHFICDIICYKDGESPQGKSTDEFDMLQEWFTGSNERVLQNISVLETYFDCWCSIKGFKSPDAFLSTVMSHVHESGKIIVENRYKLNIFEDCLHTYADRSGRNRLFPLNRIILLYAIIAYLLNQETISWAAFIRRIRVINNLIQNSEDEISDRTDRNRIPAILMQTDAIMLTGEIDDSIENSFNTNQLAEEKEKQDFEVKHPELTDNLFKLEDHPNLKGQVSIVGLDHLDYADRFISLFSCDWDKIDCALMSLGDYGQQERNGWRYQYGSSGMLIAWDTLFHRGSNSGFENTKDVLLKLLSRAENFSDDFLQSITDDFISSCESAQLFPWRYYYVKYRIFRPGSYGKYSKIEKGSPYMFLVMKTKSYWSESSYVPFLKEVEKNMKDRVHLSEDSKGLRLLYETLYITCNNNAYIVHNNEDEQVINMIPIQQNENGIDTEDRIQMLRHYLEESILPN